MAENSNSSHSSSNSSSNSSQKDAPTDVPFFYDLLGVEKHASPTEIRQAYRQKSKEYHPDTTLLETRMAAEKFRALTQAYQTLSNFETRRQYDSRNLQTKTQPPSTPNSQSRSNIISSNRSAFLDAHDRPLSPGEIFALFILGLTFLACLILAIVVGIARGEVFLGHLASDVPNVKAPSPLIVPPPRTSPPTSINKTTPWKTALRDSPVASNAHP